MRLGSVFKMWKSILNTATTEQMEYRMFSFFVYTKSTNQSDSPKVYAFYSDGNFQKKCVNHLDFNSPGIHNLLENPHSHQLWI